MLKLIFGVLVIHMLPAKILFFAGPFVYLPKIDTNQHRQIEQLIASGDKNSVTGTNSLKIVADKLKNLGQANNDREALVYAEFFNAKFAWLSANHLMAMKFAMKTLADAQKWKVNKPLSAIYALIANLHKENTNYPMAFAAADNGLNIAKQGNDTAQIIALLGLKAMLINTFSLAKFKPGADDGSIELQFEGLRLAESSPKYERLRIRYYDNIAQHFKDKRDYEKAIYYAKKGIDLAIKYDKKRSLTYSYNWLGESYFYAGDRRTGMSFLNKALDISKQIKQPYRTMEIYQSISDCYKTSSDYKNAYDYITKYLTLYDSLKVVANEKQLSELQMTYETARKDKEIKLLAESDKLKSRQMIWFVVVIILFIILATVLLFMYRIIAQRNKMLKIYNVQISEQSQNVQTLMQELHHRVKNNLQIVSSLLSLQSSRLADSDARNALNISSQRIAAMSMIHHSLYQHDSANMVDMKEYITNLLNSIVQSFGVKFDEVDLRIDVQLKDIDVDIALPLGLIINEWMTNVFKHAFGDDTTRPQLEVALYHDGEYIKLNVKDNGIGMPIDLWDNPKASFGIKLMKVLMKQIRAKSKIKNCNGTMLELNIPLN